MQEWGFLKKIYLYTLLVVFLQCANGADVGEEGAKVREDDLLHKAKLLLQFLYRKGKPVREDETYPFVQSVSSTWATCSFM